MHTVNLLPDLEAVRLRPLPNTNWKQIKYHVKPELKRLKFSLKWTLQKEEFPDMNIFLLQLYHVLVVTCKMSFKGIFVLMKIL